MNIIKESIILHTNIFCKQSTAHSFVGEEVHQLGSEHCQGTRGSWGQDEQGWQAVRHARLGWQKERTRENRKRRKGERGAACDSQEGNA